MDQGWTAAILMRADRKGLMETVTLEQRSAGAGGQVIQEGKAFCAVKASCQAAAGLFWNEQRSRVMIRGCEVRELIEKGVDKIILQAN